MSMDERFSPAGWAVMEAAKSISMALKADTITPQHIFQGCVKEEPELVRSTLAKAGLDASELAACLSRVNPPSLLPSPQSGPRRELEPEAQEVVLQAISLALEHPGAEAGKVGAVHLWVSSCAWLQQDSGWLRKCGWATDCIGRVRAAAAEQLPPTIPGDGGLGSADLEILARFCRRNLTELARTGVLTPAFGVDSTRDHVVLSLLRLDRRSVVLTGPPGTGKTKLVEDLAVRVARGEIPELVGCQVWELDLTAFTRGTHLAGSRAERWGQLTDVLRRHADRVILFIDELHTIIGLPLEGQAMDLSNVLKPLLVDDRIRIVGATTSEEYRRHIEGDPALARRFAEVKISEPDKSAVIKLLEQLAPRYEGCHGVAYSREALEAIYELANAYFPNQYFPAKGVDLLDEVGVHVRVRERVATPAQPRLVQPNDVREALRRTRGIEPETFAVDIAALLKDRIVGQDHAADRLADAIIASAFRYGKNEPDRPRSVILFLGPPGVGKSFMAEALSDILFPGRRNLLALDMAEFSGSHAGEHARWRLLGPPPPYVGWENGGLLTSHALRNPASVVLVDEFDKASPEAQSILLRVFNDGSTQDGRGRLVSFRSIYFVLTANAAQNLWHQVRRIGFDAIAEAPSPPGALTDESVREVLAREGFAPELLSRISHVVLFRQLSQADLARITERRLEGLRDTALVDDAVLVEWAEEVPEWLVQQCGPGGDVRRLGAVFERYVETPIARWRWEGKEAKRPLLLRLRVEEDAIRLATDTKETAGDRIEQLLFARVAAVFASREEKGRQVRTAGARLAS